MSRRKVVNILSSLVERGILVKCHTDIKNGYKVNYGEVEAMALGQKGVAATQNKGSELVHEVHSASAPGAPKRDKEKQRYHEPHYAPSARSESLDVKAYNTRHWDRKGADYLRVTWTNAWKRAGYGKVVSCSGWGQKHPIQSFGRRRALSRPRIAVVAPHNKKTPTRKSQRPLAGHLWPPEGLFMLDRRWPRSRAADPRPAGPNALEDVEAHDVLEVAGIDQLAHPPRAGGWPV